MKGHVRTQQTCPVCRKNFSHIERLGYICKKHKTIPNRFYIDTWHKGTNYKIFSEKTGQVISSYEKAYYCLERINEEINLNRFDPSHWIQTEAAQLFVPALLERFRDDKLPNIAPTYKKLYRIITSRISAFFPGVDVRELRKLDILNYRKHLEKGGMHGKTLKNNMDLFKTFLNWCLDAEIILRVPPFPLIEVSDPPTKWITREDQVGLYELAPEEDRPIIAFLALHGCRPAEARALRIQDVYLAGEMITISSTWSLNVLRPHRKGKRSPAVTFPIHAECMDYIRKRCGEALPGAFLFINPRSGNHYTDSALDRVWKGILKKAGIKGLRKYDALRHSFASNLVNSGVPIMGVKDLMGHTSVKTTERYTHADLRTMRANLEKLSLKKIVPLSKAAPKKPEVNRK